MGVAESELTVPLFGYAIRRQRSGVEPNREDLDANVAPLRDLYGGSLRSRHVVHFRLLCHFGVGSTLARRKGVAQ